MERRKSLSRAFWLSLCTFGLASTPVLAGNDAWSVVGQPSGGTVEKVAVNPATPSMLYAVSGAGIFMSTDSGSHWSLSLPMLSNNASDVAVDPLTPATVYAASQGQGLWKSTDGGATWTASDNGLPDASSSDPQLDGIYQVVVDPVNEGTVYAVLLNNGIYRSTDGGAHWTAANGGLSTLLAQGMHFLTALAVDPASPSTLYMTAEALPSSSAGGAFVSDPSSGLYKSTDGGSSWSEVVSSMGFGDVVVDPKNHLNVYASGPSVYVSNDGGSTFTPQTSGDWGLVENVIAVDPTNSLHMWGVSIFNGLYMTTDQGTTWTAVTSGNATYVTSVAVDPVTPAKVYMSSVNFGMFSSTDGGSTWTESDSGIYNVVTQDMFMGGDGAIYIGSLGTGILKSTDHGADWSQVNNGITSIAGATGITAYALTQDPKNPATLYAGTVGGLYQTTDAAKDWTLLNNGITDPYTTAVAVDPENDQNVYIGTQAHDVFKSTDGGASWTASSTGITDTEVLSLAVSPSNSKVVFAGTPNKGLFMSADGGSSWSPVNTANLTAGVWAIAIDPADANTIYISLENQDIYKSTDGGQTWASSSNGLPAGYIFNTVTIDSSDPSILYVVGIANSGVYVSTDAGADWSALGNNGLAATTAAVKAVTAVNNSTLGLAYRGRTRPAATNTGPVVMAVALDPKSKTVYGGASDGQVYAYSGIPGGSGSGSGSGSSSSGGGGGAVSLCSLLFLFGLGLTRRRRGVSQR